MKDIYWVLFVMLAGISIHTLLSDVLTGIANHQATLQTLVQLILALGQLIFASAYLCTRWPENKQVRKTNPVDQPTARGFA